MAAPAGIVYWDTSAVMSALFRDAHSERAAGGARRPGTHLISSLGWAESHALIARIERERALGTVLVAAARETLAAGPWARINVDPDWQHVVALARSRPLRGADLWHLGAVKTLQTDLPEVKLLSFDQRLAAAARGEGCAH